ncbi:P-loop containing nucleoside triphosphate hydrolase protein [Daldinia caldariorum]|uniref:P-loop containing nucleoside triphosphate hydrolase protein n=1 Tax=Daldinia caldariorum TaxID=326644 RepID=UPI00200881A1|nr:P-loop containing nucleoside triphosphate hydrolase protein [Daldinia caldariorum]KAI1463758.1 P-loop containing nucleoside triphosphate hydrolase protein [Daldinia caldariorum]
MTHDDDAAFRPGQFEVLQAIVQGHSPIVQVQGTGGGKSLSFMLPAYCAPDGITLVVMPLVALRKDMQRRCQVAGIRTFVYRASAPTDSDVSIVFVTPETLTSKSFQTYLARLQQSRSLDRIVVDECHMVLDVLYAARNKKTRFREGFVEIGGILEQTGVQLVFLTATLPLQDETNFYRAMKLRPYEVELFRRPTTRANLRYHVRMFDPSAGPSSRAAGSSPSEEEIRRALVAEVVVELLATYERGKVIVYCGTVGRTKAVGEQLGCSMYYSGVGSDEQKARIVEDWITGALGSRVIAATNALGAGLDVPDIRAVVHADAPYRLSDFAQESGRAGRDGAPADSIVLCRRIVRDEGSNARAQAPPKGLGIGTIFSWSELVSYSCWCLS